MVLCVTCCRKSYTRLIYIYLCSLVGKHSSPFSPSEHSKDSGFKYFCCSLLSTTPTLKLIHFDAVILKAMPKLLESRGVQVHDSLSAPPSVNTPLLPGSPQCLRCLLEISRSPLLSTGCVIASAERRRRAMGAMS